MFGLFVRRGDCSMTAFSTEEIRQVVDEHNRLRREVGVPDIDWDAILAANAQTWADAMARDKKFEHSRGRHGEGENIAYGLGYSRSQCIDIALEGWGEKEKSFYLDYGEPLIRTEKYDEMIGHYTQMVWDRTTHVGVAITRADNGDYYTCARYSPAGNIIGQHPYGGPIAGKEETSKRSLEKPPPEPAPTRKRTPPEKSVTIKKSGAGELVLTGLGGKQLSVRMKTALGEKTLAQFGEDSQYFSEPQFTLETNGEEWVVTHHRRAKNETLLNGKAVSSPATLKNGDELAVGREAKGIIKLPLKVQIN